MVKKLYSGAPSDADEQFNIRWENFPDIRWNNPTGIVEHFMPCKPLWWPLLDRVLLSIIGARDGPPVWVAKYTAYC